MIVIRTKWFYKLIINASTTSFGDAFLLSCYSAYRGKLSKWFYNSTGYTLLVDLSKSEDELLMDLKSNTRNEVRRGIREGFIIKDVTDFGSFVDYYNDFAQAKHLATISLSDLTKYPEVIVCAAEYEGKPLTMHASFVDRDNNTVSLLYSASIRLEENVDKKYIGISNRFLHYMEFVKFKKMGFTTYDFSGVCEDENNREEYTIGQFKKGFGGQLVERHTMYSYPMLLALKLFHKE